jgi:hypothetical protein
MSQAEHELKLLSDGDPDETQQAMNKHILEMVKLFAEEGHSGFSASYAIRILEKLLRFEPLVALTGELLGHAVRFWHRTSVSVSRAN